MATERMTNADSEEVRCVCGNDAMDSGFVGANITPAPIISGNADQWTGEHIVCSACGRIARTRDGVIVARLTEDADGYFPCLHDDTWNADERRTSLKWCQDCGREWTADGAVVPVKPEYRTNLSKIRA